MDHDKAVFLFGAERAPAFELEIDDADEFDNDAYVDDFLLADGLPDGQRTIQQIVCNHIAGGDPPETWATAQRLLAAGLERSEVLEQLGFLVGRELFEVMREERAFDYDSYFAALELLPFPALDELRAAADELLHDRGVLASADLRGALAERFDVAAESNDITEAFPMWSDSGIDRLLAMPGYTMLHPDLVVHGPTLARGIVLTHVVSEDEIVSGVLDASFDLAPFCGYDSLHTSDGSIEQVAPGALDAVLWHGPAGWLDALPPGSTVAVRVDDDDLVSLEALPAPPDVNRELSAALRAAYELESSEWDYPFAISEILSRVRIDDPASFQQLEAPLTELCLDAGLQVAGGQVARDESVWQADREDRLQMRLQEELGDGERVGLALDVLDQFARYQAGDEASPADRRSTLAVLADDDDLLEVVLNEISRHDLGRLDLDSMLDNELDIVAALSGLAGATADGVEEDDEEDELPGDPFADDAAVDAESFGILKREMLAPALRFTEHLVDAATKPRHVAVARYAAAIVAEEAGETLVAEQHLLLALQADPDNPMVIDRCAWYASDRGDAARAVALWRRISTVEGNPALAIAEQFSSTSADKVGRNEPCWCGSGKKYKQCHLGKAELPALPDRVGWLAAKAVAYLARCGGDPGETFLELAGSIAEDPDDTASLAAALEDPIVLDLTLTEEGFFELFLEERGPLLPDDEALLAASWILVDRTIYEMLEVRPGEGMTVRDLRTGEQLEIRERTYSRMTATGELLCARAVPDGETQQLVGGQFTVRPGTEGALLELLDEGDGFAIADWLHELYRPPRLTTREGEDLITGRARIETSDEVGARRFLDRHFTADGPRWVELYALNDDEDIVRSTLTLDGSVVVAEANSDVRMDRVLNTITSSLDGAKVLSDEREPVDIHSLAEDSADSTGIDAHGRAAGDPEAIRQGLLSYVEQQERRWCEEPVPALDGWTPRDAVGDPTRRDAVRRLIASFPEPDPDGPPNVASFRPARLRELLGLEE